MLGGVGGASCSRNHTPPVESVEPWPLFPAPNHPAALPPVMQLLEQPALAVLGPGVPPAPSAGVAGAGAARRAPAGPRARAAAVRGGWGGRRAARVLDRCLWPGSCCRRCWIPPGLDRCSRLRLLSRAQPNHPHPATLPPAAMSTCLCAGSRRRESGARRRSVAQRARRPRSRRRQPRTRQEQHAIRFAVDCVTCSRGEPHRILVLTPSTPSSRLRDVAVPLSGKCRGYVTAADVEQAGVGAAASFVLHDSCILQLHSSTARSSHHRATRPLSLFASPARTCSRVRL